MYFKPSPTENTWMSEDNAIETATLQPQRRSRWFITIVYHLYKVYKRIWSDSNFFLSVYARRFENTGMQTTSTWHVAVLAIQWHIFGYFHHIQEQSIQIADKN